MKDERRDAIIKDLLLRRPKGDVGIEPTFEEYEEWCYDARKDKKYIRCEHPGWGYSDDTLFLLGFRSSSQVTHYVLQKFYGVTSEWDLTAGQKAGCTRKSRRIWSRIQDGVRRVAREGRPGIYKICAGYYSTSIGTVYATDHEDAKKLGEMFYGYLLADDDNGIRTEFIKMGGIEEIQSANQRAIEGIEKEVSRAEERIKEFQAEVARKRMQIDAIQMLQMHTLSQMANYIPPTDIKDAEDVY